MTTCAWCDRKAVVLLELEPAKYTNETTWDEKAQKVIVVPRNKRFAVKAWACPDHMLVTSHQPPPVKTPHTTKSRAHAKDQLSIFDVPGVGPANAIHGDQR